MTALGSRQVVKCRVAVRSSVRPYERSVSYRPIAVELGTKSQWRVLKIASGACTPWLDHTSHVCVEQVASDSSFEIASDVHLLQANAIVAKLWWAYASVRPEQCVSTETRSSGGVLEWWGVTVLPRHCFHPRSDALHFMSHLLVFIELLRYWRRSQLLVLQAVQCVDRKCRGRPLTSGETAESNKSP
jgi:hypothetical protein